MDNLLTFVSSERDPLRVIIKRGDETIIDYDPSMESPRDAADKIGRGLRKLGFRFEYIDVE